MENNKAKKPLSMSKSKSKSLPVIKQTKTSMIRMLKANPLMISNDDLSELVPNSESKKYDPHVDFYLKKLAPKPVQKRELNFDSFAKNIHKNFQDSTGNSEDGLKQLSSGNNMVSKSKLELIKNVQPSEIKKINENLKRDKSNSLKKSTVLNSKPYEGKIENNVIQQNAKSKSEEKTNFSRNRNATLNKQTTYKISGNKDKNEIKKCENNLKTGFTRNKNLNSKITNVKERIQTAGSNFDIKSSVRNYRRRSRSEDSLSTNQNKLSYEGISSVDTNKKHTVQFKTPITHNRQSASYVTPGASRFQRPTSTPFSLARKETTTDLQRRLNNWLKLKGKSLTSYHHLKCFDVNQQLSAENKENIEVVNVRSESYEHLNIVVEEEQNETEEYVKNLKNLPQVARDALDDLHKLILEGYPLELCNAWLSLIRDKYQDVEDEPQYWECRAAIEQMQGNISSAITFYRTAIVQGAEVNKVDQSLEQLLQKFSVLNISINSPSANEDIHTKKQKQEKNLAVVRDAFKSTIIQFAIQERTIKKDQAKTKQFFATPVRRSTRQSLSKYKLTPDVHICSSLHNLDQSVQENLEFCCNKNLSVRYRHE